MDQEKYVVKRAVPTFGEGLKLRALLTVTPTWAHCLSFVKLGSLMLKLTWRGSRDAG